MSALSPLSIRNAASPRSAVSPKPAKHSAAHNNSGEGQHGSNPSPSALFAWTKAILAPYGVDVKNLTSSWSDGGLLPFPSKSLQRSLQNRLNLSFPFHLRGFKAALRPAFYALALHFGANLPPLTSASFGKDKAKINVAAALKAGSDIGVSSPFSGNDIDNIIYGNIKDQLKAKIVEYLAKYHATFGGQKAAEKEQPEIKSPVKTISRPAPVEEVVAPEPKTIDFDEKVAEESALASLSEEHATEVKALMTEIEAQKKVIDLLNAEVEKVRDEVLKGSLDSERQANSLRQQLSQLKLQFDELKGKEKEWVNLKEELNKEVLKGKQQIAQLKSEGEELKKKEKALLTDKEEMSKEVAVTKMKLGRVNTELTELKAKEKEMGNAKEASEKSWRGEKDELTKELGVLKTKISRVTEELAQFKANEKDWQAEKETMLKEKVKKEHAVSRIETDVLVSLNKQMERNEALTKELDEAKKEAETGKANLSQIKKLEKEKEDLDLKVKTSEEALQAALQDKDSVNLLLGLSGALIVGLVGLLVWTKISDK